MKKSATNEIRVFIADDHAIARQGIKMILSLASDFNILGEAEGGHEVLEKILSMDNVDVLLMDIEMPGKNGWDVLQELKSLRPKLPILVLSIFPEEHYGARFLKAGAAGYLSKASTPEEIVSAIRRVSKGGKFVSPDLAEKLLFDLGKDNEKLLHENLSDREFQVLGLIASGKKIKAIAEELSVGITTISSYRARILEKMGMKTNAELIHYALKNKIIS
ncbi:MAG: response regulator [Nitrospinales bacterium]